MALLSAHSRVLAARLLFLLLAAFVTSDPAVSDSENNDNILPFDYVEACTQGNITFVAEQLQKHPGYLNGRTSNGETCLHVAGIMGQTEVTKYVLTGGANPDIRSIFEHGLRMTPLSWNVFGGHLETAKALLDGGAQVNLDVDTTANGNGLRKVTVLDIVEMITPEPPHPDMKPSPKVKKFIDLKAMLIKYGAKKYEALVENTAVDEL
jgi:ankyrin repeat protein